MRTKTLLLTAALSAAGVAASMAQVYSVNVVGYVNVTVDPGKWVILSNPLSNGDNNMNTVLALPDTADGVYIYRFDSAAQTFKDAYQFTAGFGWYSPSDNSPVLVPGEGFFFLNPNPAAVTLTFVGEVMQTGQYTLTVPLTGNGKFNLVGSQVPMAQGVGDTTINAAGTMQVPAVDGDYVYIYDYTKQTYNDAYGYTDGYGWYSPSDPAAVAGPTIPVGGGFWVYRSGGNASWTRTFNVQ